MRSLVAFLVAVVVSQNAVVRSQETSGDDPAFQVDRGQFTFDAEGVEGGSFPSRTPRVPSESSGVTIGRGYDMGERPSQAIVKDLMKAGVSQADAQAYGGAAGLKGEEAERFVDANRSKLVEMTTAQQKKLFVLMYDQMVADVRRISDGKETAKLYGKVNWNKLDPRIEEGLVDLMVRGDYTDATRKLIQKSVVNNDFKTFQSAMESEGNWVNVPEARFERGVNLMQHLLNTPMSNRSNDSATSLNQLTVDRDDQISEAKDLETLRTDYWKSESAHIDLNVDVDMYKFTVRDRALRVYFDVDTIKNGPGGLGSYMRIFDAQGTQLAFNNDAAAPGDLALGFDSFLRYTFPSEGTYYVGISNFGNPNYHPIFGVNDTPSRQHALGKYRLKVRALGEDRNDSIAAKEAKIFSRAVDRRPQQLDGEIEWDVDVEMFRIILNKPQSIDIDIDTPRNAPGAEDRNLDSYIRVFDSNGNQIPGAENDNGAAPDEKLGFDSFLRLSLAAGKYFVGVSNKGNIKYNAVTGGGDTESWENTIGVFKIKIGTAPEAQNAVGNVANGNGKHEKGGFELPKNVPGWNSGRVMRLDGVGNIDGGKGTDGEGEESDGDEKDDKDTGSDKELSGTVWIDRFPTSVSLEDLDADFKESITNFQKALTNADASFDTHATRHPKERSYLMHWSWRIAKKNFDAKSVPEFEGVPIEWWHGDQAQSKAAAREMMDGYDTEDLTTEPSLNSRHCEGKAIDMSVTWSGTLKIKKADGTSVVISSTPRNATNAELIAVGATYGVVHFSPASKDRNHWSTDGK